MLYFNTPASAQKVAGSSAVRKLPNYYQNQDKEDYFNKSIKKMVLKKVFSQYNSPLIYNINDFINTCQEYNLDCYLLPSIAGLESYFGNRVLPQSHNPFGWGGGLYLFPNYSHSINYVGKNIKQKYINKGANTVEKIGRIYAASPTWSIRVRFFLNKFNNEENKLKLYFETNSIEL